MGRGGKGIFSLIFSAPKKNRVRGARWKNRASASYYPGAVFDFKNYKLLLTKKVMHNLKVRKINHQPPRQNNGPSLTVFEF